MYCKWNFYHPNSGKAGLGVNIIAYIIRWDVLNNVAVYWKKKKIEEEKKRYMLLGLTPLNKTA